MTIIRGVDRPERQAGLPAAMPLAWVRDPAAVFVLLSAIFGSVIVAATPPLRGPDEAAHFLRAYGIAQGDIIPSQADAQGRKGILLPAQLHRQFAQFEARYAHERAPFRAAAAGPVPERGAVAVSETAVFVHYAGSEGYAPASYLPHAAAAWVARQVGLDFLGTLYLMRVAGLAAMTMVAAYAIVLVPSLKWAFAAIAMLPAALYGRAVINADAGTLAFTMVVTALCLRGTPLPHGCAQHAPWLILCVLSKPPNIALVALEAMRAPVNELARHWCSLLLVVAPAVAAALAWIAVSASDAGTWRLVILTGRPPEQFDPVWKLRFMLEQPLHFPSAVLASFSDPGELWRQLIGVLGLFNTVLQPWVYPALSAALALACMEPMQASARVRHWAAAAAAITAAGYVLAVLVIFYLVWTPADAAQIWGIQGRYFIPVLPALAIVLSSAVHRGLSDGTRAVVVVLASILSGAACIEAIWRVEWNASP